MSLQELSSYCRDNGIIQYCFVDKLGLHPPDEYIDIPCGTCFACLKRKRLEWSFRLLQEISNHKESTFVTLTFDDDSLKQFSDNPKKALMLYIDRLRKHLGYRPRYWFISELGEENNRLHFHGIFFGTSKKDFPFDVQRGKWQYGNVWLGYVNFRTANYVTKYMLKFQKDYKPIMLLSNGIGLSYIKKDTLNFHLNNFDPRMYCTFLGRKYPLSNYYKTKLFDDYIKVILMINRYNDISPKEWFVNGFKFQNKSDYDLYRKKYFQDTLRRGTSLPIKPMLIKSHNCIYPNFEFIRNDNKQLTLFTNSYLKIYGKKVRIS